MSLFKSKKLHNNQYMPERRENTPPFTEMVKVETQEQELTTYMERVRAAKSTIEEIKSDPDLVEGKEAALRTVSNTAISIADTVPGFGELASWGADLAKVWARYDYEKRREDAVKNGEDPDEVELSKIDLTPDVSVKIAVLTELLELLTGGLVPSHAIETGLQLKADWPKLKKAAEKLQVEYRKQLQLSLEEREAADVLDVEFIEVTQNEV